MILPFITHAQYKWMTPPDNPTELGDIDWHRNYDKAILASHETDKDIFILFQEVPGCSTCTAYGESILSHPLLVEAIEEHFIPLCIYNNKKGHDATILKKFKEPSWNNPVARIINKDGKDIIPRMAGNYSYSYVINGIIDALRNSGKTIPEYLQLMEREYSNQNQKEIILGMFCFWSGEKHMATIPGVVETEAGFMNGNEVVKVTYDPEVISSDHLINSARKGNSADVVFSNSIKNKVVPVKKIGKFRKDKESKYYLYHSPYRALPMTQHQQLLANSEIARGGDITYLLSDRQQRLKEMIEKIPINYNAIGVDIIESWKEVVKQLKD
jgi:hypothetical protein